MTSHLFSKVVDSMSDVLEASPEACGWFIKQFGEKEFGWSSKEDSFTWTMPPDVYKISAKDLGVDP